MSSRRETAQRNAQAVEDLLDLPVMRQARQAVREKVYNTWVQCTDPDERGKLHSIAVANEELWKVLDGYINTGDVELHNMDRLKRFDT